VDAKAFEKFFRDMHPKLVRYAKRRLNADLALDVSSQAMQTIWAKKISAPRDEIEQRQLQSLAYRIVEGHIRNAQRADRRYLRVIDAVADVRRVEPAYVGDIADLVIEVESSTWIDKLSLTDREVLSLLADGYAVSEIAVILECTPAAVSMRLQRARKNLKIVMGRGAHDD
jgi:RNA polymerase sigma-70 factor (ECF subfamily)